MSDKEELIGKSLPMPLNYEGVRKAHVETAKALLFQPGWNDGTNPNVLSSGEETQVKTKSFSYKEVADMGINPIVFEHVLLNVMKLDPRLVTVSAIDDNLMVSVGVADYQKHIAPQIRTNEKS